jgi:hypothetical protein
MIKGCQLLQGFWKTAGDIVQASYEDSKIRHSERLARYAFC